MAGKWEQFTLRAKSLMLNNLIISVNSVRWLLYENIQHRSPEQKQFGVNLLVRRLVGRSAGPLGSFNFSIRGLVCEIIVFLFWQSS
jgi:hypothetical protein